MSTLLQQLWLDEAGYLLSAEAVTVGTLGVVGATVGIGAVSKSVNDELTEAAFAIRSLDQSFVISEQRGQGAWTAGSEFVQPSVTESHADLARYLEANGGRPVDRTPQMLAKPQLPELAPTEEALLPRDVSALSPAEREDLRRIRQQERQSQRSAGYKEPTVFAAPE